MSTGKIQTGLNKVMEFVSELEPTSKSKDAYVALLSLYGHLCIPLPKINEEVNKL